MARVESNKKKSFNEYRFVGLNYKQRSNKYLSMHHLNEDGTKIAIRVGESHLLKTAYGYAFILDRTHVVFVKDWQVNCNYYGNYIVLDKAFFNVKEWGEHEDFADAYENELTFDYYLDCAKAQEARQLAEEENSAVLWEF